MMKGESKGIEGAKIQAKDWSPKKKNTSLLRACPIGAVEMKDRASFILEFGAIVKKEKVV